MQNLGVGIRYYYTIIIGRKRTEREEFMDS